MKLTIRLGAAIGIAALSACAQGGEDNAANLDANLPADETVLPPDENAMGADTLGNQMNELNETDPGNMTDNGDEADNTVNGY